MGEIPDGRRSFAVAWHLAWSAAVAVVGGLILWGGAAIEQPEVVAAGLSVAAGLAGALLAASGGEAAAMGAVAIWAAASAAASLLTGAASGPLAAWCLAPLAAASAFGRPRILALGAALAAGAAAITAIASFLAPIAGPSAPVAGWLSLTAITTTAIGFAAGAIAMQGRLLGRATRWRDTELELREMLDQQPQLLMALYPGGRVLEVHGQGWAGLNVRSLADRNLLDLVAPEERPAVEQALFRAASEGSAEAAFSLAEDPEAGCELTLRRMSSSRIIGALRDARAQHRRERELVDAREAAEQQNAGKSRFLANMSHELRTPLNAIMGFSDIMRQRLFGPMADRYAEYADLIHESGAHLLELINDILDMSKIEAERFELTREVFDVGEAIGAVQRLMRGQAERGGVQLRTDLPPGRLMIEADRRAIKQITLNLVSNALRFTQRGGAVTVIAQTRDEALELIVSDTGVGIAAGDLERLGQPFEQAGDADQRAAGSGLGLSLVRAFARLHGGDMVMESALGEGTTVTVRMPVIAPAAARKGNEDISLEA
jgi:cell cycle sensor histidine kinase DivJ